MIKIENVDVYGFEVAIRGMRNPLNSWDKSDSSENFITDTYDIGENDSRSYILYGVAFRVIGNVICRCYKKRSVQPSAKTHSEHGGGI